MPLYDAICKNCETKLFDHMGKLGGDITCPTCQGTMSKMVSRTNFELKGGCWERDGYSNGNCSSQSEG